MRHRCAPYCGNSPPDLYTARGLIALLGDKQGLRLAAPDAVAGAIGGAAPLVLLPHVNYRSGRIHDREEVTRLAHAAGALILWDLAHSAGAMPVDLAGSNADFAVGCGYKYLNGGASAAAFLSFAHRLQPAFHSPLTV